MKYSTLIVNTASMAKINNFYYKQLVQYLIDDSEISYANTITKSIF